MAEPTPKSNEAILERAEETGSSGDLASDEKTIVDPGDHVVVKPPRTDVFRENEKLREHW
jgi:hypothetical protein